LAKVTDPVVTNFGLPPEIPAMRKYVSVRSKHPEVHKALREDAAFISKKT
jgi:hypothetical protein